MLQRVPNLCYESPMETNEPYYVQKLRDDLTRRQRKSPGYSMRAFGRDIGIHPAALSQILSGKRGLPLKESNSVIQKLSLGPKEKTLFFESLYKSKSQLDAIKIDSDDERMMLDESYHRVIVEWEHYAVLSLFDLSDFDSSISAIACRLNINVNRAKVVVQNLMTSGLLEKTEKGLRKCCPKVRTTEDVSSETIKQSHHEAIDLGKKKLDEVDVTKRDYSTGTWAIDPTKITEAKIIIREFRQKMASLFKEGNKTEVYQIAIQFYPLTDVNSKEVSNEI